MDGHTLQLLLWIAAFWVAVLGYAALGGSARRSRRWLAGLTLGAVLAHAVWVLLRPGVLLAQPAILLDPTRGATILAVPLGILASAWGVRPAAERARYLQVALGSLPLAFATARLGCLAAACCHGVPTELPWGLALPGSEVPRHPTPFYEMVGCLALFLALMRLPRRMWPAVVLAGLGVIRLVVTPWRATDPVGEPILAAPWAGRPALRRRPAASERRRSGVVASVSTSSCRLRGPGLPEACLAVTSAWTLLVLGAALSLGPFPTYAGVCALVLALRSPRRPPLREAALALGASAGFASYPAWIAMVVLGGVGLDLAPRLPQPPLPFAVAPWVAFVLLGPVFEELLYREKLLPALEARFGRAPAVVTSSAAFALPHLEPWTVLTTFLLGLALAALYLRAGSVAPCIGLHMGLNLAALACGVPPTRWALLPPEAAITGVLLAALAVRSSRARPEAPRPG